MQRAFVVFSMCLLIPTLALFGQAKFEVEGGMTLDWGKVSAPKEGFLEGTIKMKNTGNRDMKLVEIKPGCGCTKTDPDKMELKPGEVSTMKVKLNINESQTGPITKSITVRWMDKEGADIKHMSNVQGIPQTTTADTVEKVEYLYLKADIQRPIMMSPMNYFAFQELQVGKQSKGKIQITNNDKVPITFSDWHADNGLVLNQTSSVTLKPGEHLELEATVVPAVKGNFQGVVVVATTNPENPTLSIKAWGFVKENESPVFQQTPKQ
ncbi:MAG: DUF1573 domain-containing protein [Ignavibacteria bacterium]|nr:DUF1573 domain-containing protein [Ignavibacteria bacterium]